MTVAASGLTSRSARQDNLGAHLSIAGGLPNALVRGRETGCSVGQIFLKNQRQWAARPLAEDEVAEFERLRTATGIGPVFAHATYLINLCAPDEAEWRRAVDAFGDELERAERLRLPFVVIHPGSHKGAGVPHGLTRLVQALDALHARTAGYRVKIALENAAGCGNLLGGRAEELGAALAGVRDPDRVVFCLDTCHLFIAGYDIRTAAGLRGTLAAFDAAVGLERVVALHLNDARAGLGSGLDRHEHIGRGAIGAAAFGRLLRHPLLGRRPMVLETPKEGDWDRKNLRALRRLRPRRTPARSPR
jgi:deoxyribonuclease IV